MFPVMNILATRTVYPFLCRHKGEWNALIWYNNVAKFCMCIAQFAYAYDLWDVAYVTQDCKIVPTAKYIWDGKGRPVYYRREGFTCFR